MGHGQFLAIRVVEVGAEASILTHKGKATNNIADRETGVMVMVVVELVVKGLQGGQGSVCAARAGWGVAAVAQC